MFKIFLIFAFSIISNFCGVQHLIDDSCKSFTAATFMPTEAKIDKVIQNGLDAVSSKNESAKEYLIGLNLKVQQKIRFYELMLVDKTRIGYLLDGFIHTGIGLGFLSLSLSFQLLREDNKYICAKCIKALARVGVESTFSREFTHLSVIPQYKFTAPIYELSHSGLSAVENYKDILIKNRYRAEDWCILEILSLGASMCMNWQALRNFYKWSPFGYKIKLKKYRLIQERIKARILSTVA